MRDHTRIERILAKLALLWHKHPDHRLGQMLSNLADKTHTDDVFYFEDTLLEEELDVALSQEGITHP